MSAYSQFFLGSKRSVAQIECLEISHPNFSTTYRVVRNYSGGISVYHENGQQYAYIYYPLKIQRQSMSNDLDSSIQVTLGDLGDIISSEWDRVVAADNTSVKPTVNFRVYRSDDLSAPIFGPIVYEIPAFAFTNTNSTFTAQAPRLNINTTGEIYSLDRFPGLRGCL
jgi:hypothetical protein